MAYVDGEADERVVNHIRRCAFCAEKAEAYRRMQEILGAALYRASCPLPETLGDFYLNVLPPGQKLVMAKHLRECPHCARELEEYSITSPEDISLGVMEHLKEAITSVIEALLIPPRLQPAAVRGRTAHQRFYRADDLNILLTFQPSASRRGTLTGVIIPRGAWSGDLAQRLASLAGTQIGLFRQGEPMGSERVNELGHFVFEGILPGEYDLTFDWQGQMILISKLVLSASEGIEAE
jgi:anti-sigma factor RsiW